MMTSTIIGSALFIALTTLIRLENEGPPLRLFFKAFPLFPYLETKITLACFAKTDDKFINRLV